MEYLAFLGARVCVCVFPVLAQCFFTTKLGLAQVSLSLAHTRVALKTRTEMCSRGLLSNSSLLEDTQETISHLIYYSTVSSGGSLVLSVSPGIFFMCASSKCLSMLFPAAPSGSYLPTITTSTDEVLQDEPTGRRSRRKYEHAASITALQAFIHLFHFQLLL